MKLSRRMMNLVCVERKGDGVLLRIRHVEAEEMVSDGFATYVPHHVYREATTREQRIQNARIHTYRRKKGSGRGKARSSRAAS